MDGNRLVLPDEPLVRIRPRRGVVPIDLTELLAYHELLYFLSWRELKVRYKQTVIGASWVVMQPLLVTLVFTLFLGRLARLPSDGIPYLLFVYVAIVPWTFFSGSVTSGGQSLVANTNLITKVYFPRVIIPASMIVSKLVDFAVAFVILMGMLVYYHVAPTRTLFLLPVLVAIVSVLALGVAMCASSLNVKYRDVGVALPVLLQVWMYASPIIYPASLVPDRWQTVYALNPIVGVVEGFRASLLGRPIPVAAVIISGALSLVLLVVGSYAFRRVEKIFADII